MARVRRRKLPKTTDATPLPVEVPALPELDERETLFIEYLLADRTMSAKNAYKRAGFEPASAHKNAHSKLKQPHMQAALELAKQDLAERIKWDQQSIMRELQIIGQSDVRDFIVDNDGNLVLRDGAPDEAWRAVSKVKHRIKTVTVGTGTETTREIEISLWDKVAANKVGGEHLGMFVKKVEVTTPQGTGVLVIPAQIAPDEWEALTEAEQRQLMAPKKDDA